MNEERTTTKKMVQNFTIGFLSDWLEILDNNAYKMHQHFSDLRAFIQGVSLLLHKNHWKETNQNSHRFCLDLKLEGLTFVRNLLVF